MMIEVYIIYIYIYILGLSYNSPKKEGVSQSVRILDFPSSHKREREGLNKYLNKRDEWGKNKNRGICIQIDQETQTIDKKDVLEWNEEGEKALMGVTSRTTLGEQEDRYTLRNYDPYKTNKQLSLGNHNLTAFHQNISTRKGGKRKSTNSAKQVYILYYIYIYYSHIYYVVITPRVVQYVYNSE